jgi:hypothetical protein
MVDNTLKDGELQPCIHDKNLYLIDVTAVLLYVDDVLIIKIKNNGASAKVKKKNTDANVSDEGPWSSTSIVKATNIIN